MLENVIEFLNDNKNLFFSGFLGSLILFIIQMLIERSKAPKISVKGRTISTLTKDTWIGYYIREEDSSEIKLKIKLKKRWNKEITGTIERYDEIFQLFNGNFNGTFFDFRYSAKKEKIGFGYSILILNSEGNILKGKFVAFGSKTEKIKVGEAHLIRHPNYKPSKIFIISGWIFSILGGLVGIMISFRIVNNPIYDEKTKKIGNKMRIVSIISFIFWLVMVLHNRFKYF